MHEFMIHVLYGKKELIWVVEFVSTLFIDVFVIGLFSVVAEVAKLDPKWIPTWNETTRGKKLVIERYIKKKVHASCGHPTRILHLLKTMIQHEWTFMIWGVVNPNKELWEMCWANKSKGGIFKKPSTRMLRSLKWGRMTCLSRRSQIWARLVGAHVRTTMG